MTQLNPGYAAKSRTRPHQALRVRRSCSCSCSCSNVVAWSDVASKMWTDIWIV
jgi:hypothetical protein